MELFSLKGKTAVVTGALGLLGKKHCEALAMAGAQVVVADLDQQAAADFASQLGSRHSGCLLNVTCPDSINEAKEFILAKYDQIDILVNNAAVNDSFEHPNLAKEYTSFELYPLEAFRKSLDVNITGVYLCAQILGTIMAQQGSGSIINIASTYGMVGPDQSIYRNEEGVQTFYKSPAYPVTKAAVINFTRYLAAYWGHRGVRVNTLSPGGVTNDQEDFFLKNYASRTLLGRMADVTDYQGALLFLASNASAYMTGANLVVDGGWTAI